MPNAQQNLKVMRRALLFLSDVFCCLHYFMVAKTHSSIENVKITSAIAETFLLKLLGHTEHSLKSLWPMMTPIKIVTELLF